MAGVSYCAYPDENCESGLKWSDYAGDGLARDCVAPATPDAGAEADARWACNLAAPFSTPALVANVNTVDYDYTARLTTDQLTLYLASETPTEIRVATRPSTQTNFGNPSPIPQFDVGLDEVGPSITDDGLTMYMSCNYRICVATRTSTAGSFGAPSLVSQVSSSSQDYSPYALANGNVIYFHSYRSGGGDIFRAEKNDRGTFNPPELVIAHVDKEEAHPVVTTDELMIYFQRDRDIQVARRNTPDEPFGPAEPVVELNSPKGDAPTWLSPDGCTMYLQSSREGGLSDVYDIWVAHRPPL